MPNLPKFAHELSGDETEEGASEQEVAWQGDNPCDGCGRHHYTQETSCCVPNTLTGENETPQHCRCWYDCQPCCKCGEDGVVLHGPARACADLPEPRPGDRTMTGGTPPARRT